MIKKSIYVLFMLGLVFQSCNKYRPDREIYLIENDYTGIQYILFDQEDGEPKEYDKKGRRIYRLNNSGVLRTQFESNPGGFSKNMRKFYYINENEEEIGQFEWITLFGVHHKNYLKDTVRFHDDSLVVFSFSTHPVGSAISPPTGCKGLAFIIDTFKNRINKYPDIYELLDIPKDTKK